MSNSVQNPKPSLLPETGPNQTRTRYTKKRSGFRVRQLMIFGLRVFGLRAGLGLAYCSSLVLTQQKPDQTDLYLPLETSQNRFETGSD